MSRHELAEPVFDSTRFREVLGHFCSGVTVITAIDQEEPVGFACQSFQSLSLDPPMVSFAPSLTSTTWPRIRAAGRFAANVLAEGQDALCQRFAVSGGDKFEGVGWGVSEGGSPVLDGALAWVDCEIVQEVEAGDHALVLGRVLDLGVPQPGRPLLFFRGRFERLAAS